MAADEHTHLRIDALRRRVQHLERELARVHEHLGLAPPPERPTPSDHEVDAVRDLLAEGRETEALRLHRDLTGQGDDEARDALESIRAGM